MSFSTSCRDCESGKGREILYTLQREQASRRRFLFTPEPLPARLIEMISIFGLVLWLTIDMQTFLIRKLRLKGAVSNG